MACSRQLPGERQGVLEQTVQSLLPDRTSGGRKHVVCTPSNQSEGSNHYHQNDRQHHRILSDILPLFLRPELTKKICHFRTFARLQFYTSTCQHGPSEGRSFTLLEVWLFLMSCGVFLRPFIILFVFGKK